MGIGIPKRPLLKCNYLKHLRKVFYIIILSQNYDNNYLITNEIIKATNNILSTIMMLRINYINNIIKKYKQKTIKVFIYSNTALII